MRRLTVLLVVCAAAAMQSALAQDQMAAIRAACAADAQKLCAGVQPGGGRVIACLKEHKDSLSERCKQAAGLAASPTNNSQPSATSSASSGSAATPSVPAAAPPAKSVAAPKASTLKDPATKGVPTKAASAKSTEKFVERVITDTEHGGMRAGTIHLPEKWHFDSKIEWHYGWVEYPLSFSSHAENPDNAEAYFQYPLVRFDFTEVPPQLKQYDRSRKLAPGERGPTGAFGGPPQPPMQALAMFVKKTRTDATNFKWLGQQDLPGLAKALHLDAWPNEHGVAIKVGYDLSKKLSLACTTSRRGRTRE